MKGWKRVLAAALLAALVLGLAAPAFGAADGVKLMAVNDTVILEVTPENMPRTVGGVLYVPYTMLSNQVNGNTLGVNAMYSTTKRTVLVTDGGNKGVEFNTQSNTARDLDDNPVTARAMVRNSTVFLPIDWLCQYFGTIHCARIQTQYGELIRITSSAAVLDDRNFVDAADNLLSSSLQRYLISGGGGGESGDPEPSENPQPSDPPSGAELFLALRWGAEAEQCAAVLEGRGQRGLFLLAPEELEEQDGLIRRLVGAGHGVGLALDGEDGPACLAQGTEGRALLAAAARYNALVASAAGLDEAGWEELTQAGYVEWSPTALGRDYASGAALVRGLSTRRVNYVELDCGPGGAAFLRGALNAMEEENCQVYQATAPALA